MELREGCDYVVVGVEDGVALVKPIPDPMAATRAALAVITGDLTHLDRCRDHHHPPVATGC